MEHADGGVDRRKLGLIALAAAVLVVAGAFALRDPLPTRRVGATQGRPLPILLATADQTPQLTAVIRANRAKRYDEASRLLEGAARTLGEGDLRIGAMRASLAFRSRPGAALNTLQTLFDDHRESAFISLQLGLALLIADQVPASTVQLQQARSLDADGFYGGKADDVLHLEIRSGYPVWVSSAGLPRGGLAALRARATADASSAAAQLAYAQALQASSRSRALVAAQRAAGVSPSDLEAKVATAVIGFEKDHPELSTGALGELAKANPASATVQFHLGEVLSWLGRKAAADRRYRRAAALDPGGTIGTIARGVLRNERAPS